jgi:hypothetical protein
MPVVPAHQHLVKAEEEDAELRMDQTEVLAQVCVFLSLNLKLTTDNVWSLFIDGAHYFFEMTVN